MEDKLVKVASYLDITCADLAKLHLEQEGIECFLIGENMGATHYSQVDGGIKLHVRESSAELAKSLLREFDSHPPPPSTEPNEDPLITTKLDVFRDSGLLAIILLMFGPHLVMGAVQMPVAIMDGDIHIALLMTLYLALTGTVVFYSARKLLRTYRAYKQDRKTLPNPPISLQ